MKPTMWPTMGTLKKIHEFGDPAIDTWTTLQVDLKAWAAKQNRCPMETHPDLIRPYSLTRYPKLIINAALTGTENQKNILDTISTFNLRARYDDYKMEFHRKCDQVFTTKWIHEIEAFRKWIKSKLPRP